jgi:CRISPR-associated protein Cas6/Cse3/CasE subtype I-E
MFVTRILDSVGDDYRVHQKVREMFPGNQRVLFQRLGGFITIVSAQKPLVSVKTTEISELKEEQFLFSVLLNPVIDRNGNPKRVSWEKIRAWVINKIKSAGADIIPETMQLQSGCRVSRKGDKLISLYSVFVTGVLNVLDKNQFFLACQTGIGHGKGLGFGLINIY